MLLIDCYNLLHAPMPPGLAGLEEARLCQLLARTEFRTDRIVVVCDGTVKPGGLARSPVGEVELVYAGREQTADELLIQMVNENTAPRRLTVCSDDRQIQKAARRRRARICSNADLIHHLCRLGVNPSRTGDRTKATSQSLDEDQVRRWAEEFGLDPDMPIDRPPLDEST